MRESADTWTLGRFYVADVQAILLFGSEMCVATPRIKRLLGGFHHRAVRRISRKIPYRRVKGTWLYLPLGDTMRAAGIEEIDTYISMRKNTLVQYTSNLPVMYLCPDMEGRPLLRAPKR